MRDRGIERVLGNVPLHAIVVAPFAFTREGAALNFHLVRCLPGAHHDFSDASHRLRVRGDHRERTEIV